MAQDPNSNADAAWRKRMALQVVRGLPEADPHTQIEILRLAIQAIEIFLVEDSAQRPAVKVVPMPPRG